MADGPAEDKPQGPTDPHGPGGIDAPAPPGGPQRTDQPSGDKTPGEAAPDPDPHPQPSHGSGSSEVQEPDRSGDGQDEDAQDLQEENAETSLDQPSQ